MYFRLQELDDTELLSNPMQLEDLIQRNLAEPLALGKTSPSPIGHTSKNRESFHYNSGLWEGVGSCTLNVFTTCRIANCVIQGLETAAAFVESRYDFYDAKGCRTALLQS